MSLLLSSWAWANSRALSLRSSINRSNYKAACVSLRTRQYRYEAYLFLQLGFCSILLPGVRSRGFAGLRDLVLKSLNFAVVPNLLLCDLVVISLVYGRISTWSSILDRFSLICIGYDPAVNGTFPFPISCIYLDAAALWPRAGPVPREANKDEYTYLKDTTGMTTTYFRP